MLTPEQRRQRARIGGLSLAAKHDPANYTREARRAFLERFEKEVDPTGQLTPAERARRAVAARRLYFARLALKSAQVRAARKKARRLGNAAGLEEDRRASADTPTAA